MSKKEKGNSHGGGWGRSDPGSGRTPPPKEGEDCLSWLWSMILLAVFVGQALTAHTPN